MEKYYLIKQLTNTQEQDASSIAVFDTLDSAIVNYHNILSAYHNADDVLYAAVMIHDFYGRTIGGYFEIVDHREKE